MSHLPHELKTPNVTDGTDYEHCNVKGCIASAHNSHGQKVKPIGAQYHVPKRLTFETFYHGRRILTIAYFRKQYKPVEYKAFIVLFDNLTSTSGPNFPFLFGKSLHAVRV